MIRRLQGKRSSLEDWARAENKKESKPMMQGHCHLSKQQHISLASQVVRQGFLLVEFEPMSTDHGLDFLINMSIVPTTPPGPPN